MAGRCEPASDATYEITHDGGVAQVTVDQTHNGGEWRYLGSWSFDPLNAPKVTLLGSLTGTLSADAIRFVAGDAIGGDIAYTHADQLGTIQKMTDAAGSLAWDRTQRPFGETIAISAASGVANQLRFPGQYADETGLSYNYFRDYDPTLGRYLESDPIGLNGGVNTYAYVGDSPVNYTDSKGLFLSFNHIFITLLSLVGEDCFDAMDLANRVSAADFDDGSQDEGNTHRHAMRGCNQSVADAHRRYEEYINQQISSCSIDGLAHALHAVQDSAAEGHRGFQRWCPSKYWPFPSIGHVDGDASPSGPEIAEAIAKSEDIIRRFMSLCGCGCSK